MYISHVKYIHIYHRVQIVMGPEMTNQQELHLTKKDFRIEWFSGSGGGGQHRNKHQNCCRIIHIKTGLRAQGTSHRERPANQKDAFTRLASLIISYYAVPADKRRTGGQTIRNYHCVRNEVLDKASRLKMSYSDVVGKGDIGPMVEARKAAIEQEPGYENPIF